MDEETKKENKRNPYDRPKPCEKHQFMDGMEGIVCEKCGWFKTELKNQTCGHCETKIEKGQTYYVFCARCKGDMLSRRVLMEELEKMIEPIETEYTEEEKKLVMEIIGTLETPEFLKKRRYGQNLIIKKIQDKFKFCKHGCHNRQQKGENFGVNNNACCIKCR